MVMDEWYIAVGLAVFGAAFGSFAGAQVWRLRAQQLVADKAAGESVDSAELKRLKPLLGKRVRDDRSRCLSCGHALAWYELLPVVSWLALRGRCRSCAQPIGWVELLLELSMAMLFGMSFLLWPGGVTDLLEVVKLLLWLVALVALAINFVYDARWFLLVPGLNWLLIGCGAVFAGISVYQAPDSLAALGSTLGGVAILGGLYAILWAVSRGKWVGEGDMYLGAGLALFLGDWLVAFVALFAANLVGTLAVAPQIVRGKMKRGAHVPFGPLLIIGSLLAWFFGAEIIMWYQSLLMP